MSDKKLNAIKEIEFRVTKCNEYCNKARDVEDYNYFKAIDEIDTLLFDIQDFINDLKDE